VLNLHSEIDESTQQQPILFTPAALPVQPAPVYFSSRSSSRASSENSTSNQTTTSQTELRVATRAIVPTKQDLHQLTLQETASVTTSTSGTTKTISENLGNVHSDESTDLSKDDSSLSAKDQTINSDLYTNASGRTPDNSNLTLNSTNSGKSDKGNNADNNNSNINANTNNDNNKKSNKKIEPPTNKKPQQGVGLILVVVEYFDGLDLKYRPSRDFAGEFSPAPHSFVLIFVIS
jgi:hypothetical protein